MYANIGVLGTLPNQGKKKSEKFKKIKVVFQYAVCQNSQGF